MSPRLRAMTDRERLLALLDVFESALADFTDLVRELRDDEWELPTDLPGWTVHDLVSHTAHLEAVIAGSPEETVAVPQGLPHVTSLMGFYTEQGVIARKERTRDELLAEIGAAAGRRLGETRAAPPDDGAGDPPKTPGDIGWSWQTLLSNRPLDVWMHEQDIRRATDRPGHLDSAAARARHRRLRPRARLRLGQEGRGRARGVRGDRAVRQRGPVRGHPRRERPWRRRTRGRHDRHHAAHGHRDLRGPLRRTPGARDPARGGRRRPGPRASGSGAVSR